MYLSKSPHLGPVDHATVNAAGFDRHAGERLAEGLGVRV